MKSRPRATGIVRAGAVVLGIGLAGGILTEALCRLALPALAGPVTGIRAGQGLAELPFDAALAAMCALAVLGCWIWLVLITLLTAVETTARVITGRSPLPSTIGLCPALVRPLLGRALLAALGVSVVASVAIAPANADGAGTGHAPAATTQGALTGLPLPDRTTGRPAAVPVARRSSSIVVVRRGDCLWALTARRLPDASEPVIDRGWRRLYAANRARIGPDPDLIVPGTRLVLPRDLREEPR
ncbi:MAG TPA: hypothetical protein VFJ19_01130 [Nocardioidaceae bacterium]|nr:hypothetical protein [Nocardioidaceae bacterium]